jgi:hypothetical protein
MLHPTSNFSRTFWPIIEARTLTSSACEQAPTPWRRQFLRRHRTFLQHPEAFQSSVEFFHLSVARHVGERQQDHIPGHGPHEVKTIKIMDVILMFSCRLAVPFRMAQRAWRNAVVFNLPTTPPLCEGDLVRRCETSAMGAGTFMPK